MLIFDGLFLCFLLGVLGTTVAYVKVGNNSSMARVLERKTVGRRLLFALLGSLTTLNWGRLGRGEFSSASRRAMLGDGY